ARVLPRIVDPRRLAVLGHPADDPLAGRDPPAPRAWRAVGRGGEGRLLLPDEVAARRVGEEDLDIARAELAAEELGHAGQERLQLGELAGQLRDLVDQAH